MVSVTKNLERKGGEGRVDDLVISPDYMKLTVGNWSGSMYFCTIVGLGVMKTKRNRHDMPNIKTKRILDYHHFNVSPIAT